MKCAWAAENIRMKNSVQLGLLCLSLFISSLHGEVVEAESSQELLLNFEEPDFHQLEMYRVQQQTVSTEENTAKRVVAVPSSENSNKKRKKPPRPGGLSVVAFLRTPTTYIHHRTKRQEKSKNNKRKIRPGSQSLIERIGIVPPPEQTAEVKRDARGERLLPES